MSAVGYCRISDKDQSNSLEDQEPLIIEYCAKYNIPLEKIFIENGKSAFTFNRPEWLKLEDYIKKHKHIKFLIVKHIDRFSRATLMDALVKLHEIEIKLKVKVLPVTDPPTQDSSDLGVQLIRSINLLFANNVRNTIQKNVKDGIYRALSNGRWCNMAPIGYKNTRQEDGKPLIVIDEDKAPFIRKIFALYKQGLDLFEIHKIMKEQGFKHKGRSAIKDILTNSVYAGIIKVPARADKKPFEVNGIHQPIISKHDFYAIQNRLMERKVSTQNNDEVWLRGVLHCPCGRLLTAGNSKSGTGKYYWYYKCEKHQVNYSAKKIHNQFLSGLAELCLDENSIQFFETKLKDAINDHQSKKGGVIMRNKLELQKITAKIQATQERFLLSPDIDPAVYSKVMNDLRTDQARLETEISKSRTDTDNMLAMLVELLPKLRNIAEIFTSWPLQQKHAFIKQVFFNSLTYSDGIYRTQKIHPLFADKALVLKEKRLIEIDKTLLFSADLPDGIRDQTGIELLGGLLNVFIA